MKLPNDLSRLFSIACRSDATVLLTGPTGSGKSSLAREIHEQSSRRERPFVTVNLASVHAGTIESELFGHERGAFTGADQRRLGKLEAAQGGTVFLDEIGELPSTLQAKLLEFLQCRSVTPVGSNQERKLNVRVIVATHRDLKKQVKSGEFREDLYHRLRVVPIQLKSLAERWDEFDAVVHQTLEGLCSEAGRRVLRISEGVAEILERYGWPGNFRELRNVLEFAVHSSTGEEIELADLPPWFAESSQPHEGDQRSIRLEVAEEAFTLPYEQSMQLFERQYLSWNLRRFRGRVNHTARQIGMSKATLIRRMRDYGLSPDGVMGLTRQLPESQLALPL